MSSITHYGERYIVYAYGGNYHLYSNSFYSLVAAKIHADSCCLYAYVVDRTRPSDETLYDTGPGWAEAAKMFATCNKQ